MYEKALLDLLCGLGSISIYDKSFGRAFMEEGKQLLWMENVRGRYKANDLSELNMFKWYGTYGMVSSSKE